MPDQTLPDIPLPSASAKNVKSAVLHVISLAQYAMVTVRGWSANSINARVRLAADNDQLNQDSQLLREELRIKDIRMAKVDPRHRPYYPCPHENSHLALRMSRTTHFGPAFASRVGEFRDRSLIVFSARCGLVVKDGPAGAQTGRVAQSRMAQPPYCYAATR